MKTKKISTGSQWLIVAIVAILIATCAVVGMSRIEADPTIYDLVETPEIGTFKPSELYVEGKTELIPQALLNTTNIFIDYDWWVDTSGDGKIDVEDVYSVEGFETHLYVGNKIYPIYEMNNKSDAYVIYLDDYSDFEAVVVQLQVANNNDQGQVKKTSDYYFDSEHNLLYLRKSMLSENIKKEEYESLRSETVFLVKSISELTRTVQVMTGFDKEIEDLHNLDQLVINEYKQFNVSSWLVTGKIEYKVAPTEYLAYLSDENMDVYINDTLMDKSIWSYDETTGIIGIASDPDETHSILLRIHALNDVDEKNVSLLAKQANNGEKTAHAKSYEEAIQGNNLFLDCLYFDDKPPEIGTTSNLGYTTFVYLNMSGNGKPYNRASGQSFFYDKKNSESIPTSVVKDAINNRVKIQNKRFNSTTYSIFRAHEKIGGERADWKAGEVVINMKAFVDGSSSIQSGNTKYLDAANQIVESYFLEHTGSGLGGDTVLSTSWNGWGNGRYISGSTKNGFLGCTKYDGNIMFDGICGRIEEPSAMTSMSSTEWREIMSGAINNSHGTSCDYHAYATIVDIATKDNQYFDHENDSEHSGYLYIMFWSKTVMRNRNRPNWNYTGHSQRVLGFSRVPYNYASVGFVNFSKLNENRDFVAGATYQICRKDNDNVVKTFKTEANEMRFELTAGEYYYVEIEAPVGYILDPTHYPFTVEGDQTVSLAPMDEKQMCDVELTVYDQTTEDYANKVPVAGIKFNLINKDTETLYPGVDPDALTTDEHGKIHFTVPTNKSGYVLQQVDTVKYYCMYENYTGQGAEKYNCSAIELSTIEDNSGQHQQLSTVHFEHRQTIDIQSQVQDKNLLEATPAILGGKDGGYVETIGGVYQLRAKEDLFLGYLDDKAHTKVTVPNGTLLTILTADEAEDLSSSNFTYTAEAKAHKVNIPNPDGTTGATRSFISAERIKWDGETYAIPNGTYEWEIVTTSAGYYNDKAKTPVDASWTEENMKLEFVSYNQTPVIQPRQTAIINVFTKEYAELKDSVDTQANEIRVDVPLIAGYPDIKQLHNAGKWTGTTSDHIKQDGDWVKTITSDQDRIGINSKEIITVDNKNGETKLTFNTIDKMGSVACKLVTTCDIVDIETGEVIPSNTELDVQISTMNGEIQFCEYQVTKSVQDPNKTEGEMIVIPNVLTKNNHAVSGKLPCGEYKVLSASFPTNIKIEGTKTSDIVYIAEFGIDNELITETKWTADKQLNEVVDAQALIAFRKDMAAPGEKTAIDVVLAPDVPIDPEDPYDPHNPDDIDNDPDDSEDITRIEDLYTGTLLKVGQQTHQWLKNHKLDIAYRIIDLSNVIKDDQGNPLEYDVSDKLPTTMSFTYVNNTVIDPDMYEYHYTMTFYYEVSEEEYNRYKADGTYKALDVNSDNKFDYYARRFSTDGSGGMPLMDVIAINENSTAFISYNELQRTYIDAIERARSQYVTISAAIDNTEWINQQMRKEINQDGTYHIFVEFGMTCQKTSIIDGTVEELDYSDCLNYGVLTIKNRELIDLD